ncbi:MAG: hypothetical protein GY749_10920 [Desulfobacteraceae bacterium]|nr:hypothetical protein [Desulfobacteraceae bacterium]
MSENYHGAMEVLEQALKLRKGDPKALNNRAVAVYLLGPGINADMFDQSYNAFEQLISEKPGFPDAFYNLGRLLLEYGRNSEAEDAWRTYLDTESTGVYAETARKYLGIKEKIKPCKNFFEEVSPVKLGDFDGKTKKQLAGFDMYPLELKKTSGKFFSKKDIRVLVLEDVIKIVEHPVMRETGIPGLKSEYGEPHRILDSFDNTTKTFVYDNFALDVKDGMVTKVIYF